ncbi:LuxR C-terminal-related transcriptional regulator [Brevundimonas sp. PAMC22021]|uniref:helix-turn-helix transcriptional regulator n=1 Tax=Brevundimonas sp. PAMC22021 TaxID=2861285 RepID=UPI001C62E632|nr:LuxR C-terminal-related transcriptional regulator [Brevundimonas sp. PAMC22021]QYF87812.1 LuxR C-terminal-related transcriptional regulator [Brevundimonas sp. PAMC22021]
MGQSRTRPEFPQSASDMQRMQEAAQTAGVLQAMGLAAFVCDAEGRVLAATPSGLRLFDDGLYLRLKDEQLEMRASGSRTLRAAIAEMASGQRIGARLLPLPGPDGGETALAEIVRLGVGHVDWTGVVVIVRWPGSDPADRASAAGRALYGFTAAEAAVAAHLLNGLSPQAVADRMEVSISTVRSHIRSTFLKAGVNSQIEMLAAIRCRI